MPDSHGDRFAVRIITMATVTVFCVGAATVAFVYATDIFLILFLAILFGVFLARVSNWLSRRTPLPYQGSLAIVTTVLVLTTTAGLVLFGVKVSSKIDDASKHIDEGAAYVREMADRYPTLKSTMKSTPFVHQLLENGSETSSDSEQKSEGSAESDASQNSEEETTNPEEETTTTGESGDDSSGDGTEAADKEKSNEETQKKNGSKPAAEQGALKSAAQQAANVVMSIFSSTFGLVVNSLLIFFTGLFFAVAPDMYRDGVVLLFPPRMRERTREVLDKIGDTLWHWLIGRFGTMLVTGIGAGVLLAVLGVPMAITLGVATALLTFIPNIGGLIALLLSVLSALPQGGYVVAAVIIGYMVLQLIESYVITPMIQQHQASLPPALLIAFQAVMGVVFGFLGAAVASPLLAATKVLIEEAYIKDVLNDEAKEPAR